jgi:hypothetical protein
VYFTHCYLRAYRRSGGDPAAGVLESTRAHTAYNGLIAGALLTYLVVALVSSVL